MNYRHIIAIATLGFLAACASAPERVAQLDEARSKVEALSREPLAQEAASKELSAAQENLKRADEALEKGEPEETVAHLGLDDYDLGGFSLGARTTVQAVGEGLRPRRAILAGMGYEGLTGWLRRKHFFLDAIANIDTASRGDPHWMAIQFMKTMKVDLEAAKLLLPTFTDAAPEWLDAFTMPTLVLCGTEDEDNGSAPRLAEALPNATYAPIPGTHMSSVTKPEFGERLAAFVGEP